MTLKTILLLIVGLCSLSILCGFSLPRTVLDPLTNAAFHSTSNTIKLSGVDAVVGLVLDTARYAVIELSGGRIGGSGGPSTSSSSPTAAAAAPTSLEALNAGRNPLFTSGGHHHRSVGGGSVATASGDDLLNAALLRGVGATEGAIFTVFYNAYHHGTTIRFAHVLDLVVDSSCIVLRVVAQGVSAFIIAPAQALGSHISSFVGLISSSSGDEDGDDDVEGVADALQRQAMEMERLSAAENEKKLLDFLRQTSRGRASEVGGEMATVGHDLKSSSSSPLFPPHELIRRFATSLDWEGLDFAITGGGTSNNGPSLSPYAASAVLLGVSGQGRGHSVGDAPKGPMKARDNGNISVTIRHIFVRPFRPNRTVYGMITDAVASARGVEGTTHGGADATNISITTIPGGEIAQPIILVNVSTIISTAKRMRERAMENTDNTERSSADGKKASKISHKNGNKVEDWRDRMRRESEEKAAQQRRDEASRRDKQRRKRKVARKETLAQQHGGGDGPSFLSVSSRHAADEGEYPEEEAWHQRTNSAAETKGSRKKKATKTDGSSALKQKQSLFTEVRAALFPLGQTADRRNSTAEGFTYTLGHHAVTSCFDSVLAAILSSSHANALGANAPSVDLHYVCPAALAFGKRGMRHLRIPSLAAVEVVLVGVSVA